MSVENPFYTHDLLVLDELSEEQLLALFKIARYLSSDEGRQRGKSLLEEYTLAMIFEKPSTRTRISFEVGMKELGGKTVILSGVEAQLGEREPVSDMAQVLSRYVDVVMARVRFHSDLEQLALTASVPVINGLSDLHHPCQALADILTLQGHFGELRGLKLLYIGDGNNVCNSLLVASAAVGIEMVVACPPAYEPRRPVGSSSLITCDWRKVIGGVHAIYTDTWISMGQEGESAKRRRDFLGYRVSQEMIQATGEETVFLHCLPAHRGEEVDAEVIDGPSSLVFDQAENRLHIQKALLSTILTEDTWKWVL